MQNWIFRISYIIHLSQSIVGLSVSLSLNLQATDTVYFLVVILRRKE